VLIDIGRLRDLRYVREHDGHIAVGALTTHDELARSSLLAGELPLLAHAAGLVGDPQVRHRGTIEGSLMHADPAADMQAVALALDAMLVARGPSGSREIPAGDFLLSLFETALEPGELLAEIRFPKPDAAGRWPFQKFTKRAIDWAIVGVAVQGAGVALVNMGQTPLRASAVEQAREHLARVLVRRALEESAARS